MKKIFTALQGHMSKEKWKESYGNLLQNPESSSNFKEGLALW
jgi:hypothetical protein